ncbi:hypothetical protein GGR55DRAFT_665988 [Xylaria sp. FL0064]|nr:hypothetical protein GGR55DRAFT_665988 [Xylaria sp. FL0064]
MEMAKPQPSEILTIPLDQFRHRSHRRFGIDDTEKYDFAAQVLRFIQYSETCVLSHEDPPTDLPLTEAPIELRPIFLPVEITFHILHYLERQPYKLRGYIFATTVIFCKPRTWADIPTFQICHATRVQTIKRYGKPSQNMLPFDSTIDILNVRQHMAKQDSPEVDHSMDRDQVRDVMIKYYHEVLRSEFPERKYYHSYSYDKDYQVTTPGNRLCSDLLRKVRVMEVDAGGGYRLPLDSWTSGWWLLGSYLDFLHGLRRVKINLWHHHTICSSNSKRSSSGDDNPVYDRYDLEVIGGFLTNWGFVSSIEVLEIERTNPKRSTEPPTLLQITEDASNMCGLTWWYYFHRRRA